MTGAAGSYFADKWTDQRRRQEKMRQSRRRFAEVAKSNPSLIQEMRDDIMNPANSSVRSFILMHSKGNHFVPDGQQYLCYYEEDHWNLRGQVSILESHKWIEDTTTTNAPRFKMSEEFVALLRSYNQ
jgi:hypothetical protein